MQSTSADGTSKDGRSLGTILGMSLVAAGILLLTGSILYYAYGVEARSRLDRLNTLLPQPVTLPAEAASAGFTPVAATSEGDAPAVDLPSRAEETEVSERIEEQSSVVVGYAASFPGMYIHPKYWAQPLLAGTDPRPTKGLPDGYTALSADEGRSAASAAIATRIRIPVIGVDSTVNQLAIIDLGDSRAYETPKNTVGHIPETVDPGEVGNGWFFGHLESPIKGEGNVFFRLPKIPEHLKNGDPVYVSLETDEGEYLYQVSATQVVHQNNLTLYDSDGATITLVSCVPRLVYDHRLLVTAKLVGIRN